MNWFVFELNRAVKWDDFANFQLQINSNNLRWPHRIRNKTSAKRVAERQHNRVRLILVRLLWQVCLVSNCFFSLCFFAMRSRWLCFVLENAKFSIMCFVGAGASSSGSGPHLLSTANHLEIPSNNPNLLSPDILNQRRGNFKPYNHGSARDVVQ